MIKHDACKSVTVNQEQVMHETIDRRTDMGRGSSTGKVSDYYKKKGQKGRGEGAKRRKLSKQGAANRSEARRQAKEANPSNG